MRELQYKQDMAEILTVTIETINSKIELTRRQERQLNNRIKKIMAGGGTVQSTERLRMQRNNFAVECASWERRLAIAQKRRKKVQSDLDYYKIGGSC